MCDQQAGQVTKGGDCHALAAGDENLFAQLDGAGRDSNHDQGLEDAFIRVAQLVAEDHRDAEHELDLLLQRVERLARDRADREHRAETGSDRHSPAQRSGCRNPPPRGTDERQGQLMIGVVRMARSHLLDLRAD